VPEGAEIKEEPFFMFKTSAAGLPQNYEEPQSKTLEKLKYISN